jgi:hypothetical protein
MLRASAVPEPVQEAPPITHQGDSDAQNTAFWKKLITSNPESLVAKETAVFAVRTLLQQTQGYKAHRAQIAFGDDPITLGDLFELARKAGRPCGLGACTKTRPDTESPTVSLPIQVCELYLDRPENPHNKHHPNVAAY